LFSGEPNAQVLDPNLPAGMFFATIERKEMDMIELTNEQRQELDRPEEVRARDPKTNETYVLIRTDDYERMRAIIDGYTRRAGWDDPALDEYEQYRKQK